MRNTTPKLKLIEGGKKRNEEEIFAELKRLRALFNGFIDICNYSIDTMNLIETQLRGQDEN